MKGVFSFKNTSLSNTRNGATLRLHSIGSQISFIKVFSQLFHIFKNSRNRKNTLLVLSFVSEILREYYPRFTNYFCDFFNSKNPTWLHSTPSLLAKQDLTYWSRWSTHQDLLLKRKTNTHNLLKQLSLIPMAIFQNSQMVSLFKN